MQLDEYRRYGRQMILDGIGLDGQIKLRQSSVLVVGAGGLGCPVLQYLAAAGVGRIGIIDGDTVELSNLHRQILHTDASIGQAKAESAANAIKRINPCTTVTPVSYPITAANAVSLVSCYDTVFDCTDNAPTRYLLSDTCVKLNKPLVSAAAQRFEGQICVYNRNSTSPCYRCLFPKPPTQQESCEEVGVLGAVTGVVGTLQAMEGIKLLLGLGGSEPPILLLYNALSLAPFRSIKLRKKKPTCPACGTEGDQFEDISEVDYVQFCGGPRPDWVARGLDQGDARVNVQDFKQILDSKTDLKLIDVRPPTEFGICHLPNSINIPLHTLVASPEQHLPPDNQTAVYVVCRLGNDSQIAVSALRDEIGEGRIVKDVVGGLRAWSEGVDKDFPVY